MAWQIYSNWEKAGQPFDNDPSVTYAMEFKKTFSREDVVIHFMGVWDSINSVGLLIDRLFPYASRPSNVHHVRHAVSIDERRAKFKPQLFVTNENSSQQDLGCSTCNSTVSAPTLLRSIISFTEIFLIRIRRNNRRNRKVPKSPEDIVEMFFPGDHADLGGGWLTHNGQLLSNVSMRWMLSQAVKFGVLFKTGSIHEFDEKYPSSLSLLAFHHDCLAIKPLSPDLHALRVSSESQGMENSYLPKTPVSRFNGRGYTLLIGTLFWWLLEFLPIFTNTEDRYGELRRAYSPNFGSPRSLPPTCILHWSLFYRLHYVADYNPSNLPTSNLGEKFIQLLLYFNIIRFTDTVKYATDLTIHKIKNDWKSNIWHIIPNELLPLLEENPDL